jgi:arylsulfatase A-like enzyme
VEEIDWSVGEILKALVDAGLDSRTLVIFTSDNGGTQRSSNSPLRGFKASTWEGGVRVPTIARWPGRIPAGSATSAITSHMDLLPTFAALAGASLPEGRVLDGVDLTPALIGDGAPRTVFQYFRGAKLEAIRRNQWKLHLAKGELYDLNADLGESTNLAPTQAGIVEELRALAAAVEPDLGTAEFGPGCRPLGRISQATPLLELDNMK